MQHDGVAGWSRTMTNRNALSQYTVAISISESPDMAVLGLTDEHLRDAQP